MNRFLVFVLAVSGLASPLVQSAAAQSLNYTNPYAITTLAGSTSGATGSVDSTTGTQARFNGPLGVAVDSGGNVYVADTINDTIRKISSAGAVTTFAGQAGVQGTLDSTTGTSAKFGNVYAIAIDQAGNLYVADWTPSGGSGATIRKITSSGSTSTLVPASVGLNQPYALAVDSADNVYVADTGNSVIRKVTPSGAVSTYAGVLGQSNNVDGPLGTGQLGFITGLTIDSAGNLYAVDHQFATIRKINGAGTITTIAGSVGNQGLADGAEANALFTHPYGIVADSSGNLYLTDDNGLVREVSAGGTVSTLAGSVSLHGNIDQSGMNASFNDPTGLAVDSSGNLYLANTGTSDIRKGTAIGSSTPPSITTQPANEGTTIAPIAPGMSVMFEVLASGTNLSYQWYFSSSSGASALSDNSQVSGSKTNVLTVSNVTTANQGGFYVVVSNPYGSATSNTAMLTVTGGTGGSGPGGGGTGGTTGPTVRLLNLSTLAQTSTGANALAVGFSVGGTGSKSLLIRGDGPALASFSVTNPLPDPVLSLYQGTTLLASNTGWFTASNEAAIAAAAQQVGAFALATNSADSAMLQTLGSGTGSATITGATGTQQNGNVLAEIYDADTATTPTARLVNISSRAVVGIGPTNALSAGFVLGGTGTDTVLIRGVGPALAPFGISSPLSAPTLTLLNQKTGATIATNTGWSTAVNAAQISAAFTSTGAFALTPNSPDCAILIGLQAGNYTATVTGVNNVTGVALVEVYEVSQSN